MKYSLYELTKKAAELLKINPESFFWQISDYTAQNALKGIYKIFIKVATPQFLLNRSRSFVTTFYKDTSIDITISEKNEGELKYCGFDTNYELIMHRIAGWINSSMSFTRAENVVTKLVNITKNGDYTFSVNVKWT